MKILLIYPYFLERRIHEEEIGVVPIGLYYVGATLKERDHAVEIVNWHDMEGATDQIESFLRQAQPDLIGFSIVHANRWGGIDIARIAKKCLPHVPIVFGGVGATFLWKHLLTHFPEIDYVVMGEGEYSFHALVSCIASGNPDQITQIKGIALRRKGQIIRNKNAERLHDLDQLPNPAKYFVYRHVSSTRGCPGKCIFCGSPKFWGPKIRFHSPDYFVRQLELLYRRGVTSFFFSDDTFTVSKGHVIKVCKQIIAKGLAISWAAIARARDVDEECLYWMRKAGCIQISYGVEHGSEKIRRTLHKDLSNEQIGKAFRLTQRYGIMARAYFIYGCPGETWQTVEETIALIHQIKPLGVIFYILDIFPGTRLYEDYQRRFNVRDDIWLERIEDILYFETDASLSQDLILAMGRKLRRTYYRHLPEYVAGLELIDQKELYDCHADFYSRLAMTFSHGDYAGIDAINDKDPLAEALFRRSLNYAVNHRAYLGLGMLKQKTGKFQEAIEIATEGIRHFENSQALHLCLAVTHMNLGRFHEALGYLLKFQDSREAAFYIAQCYKALGDGEKEISFLKKSQTNSA
jgi:radical SAM superfamily enzyme YgiQ (UPF0313 family)